MRKWFFLLLLILIVPLGLGGPIISVPPVDTVGCYGRLSTFYCESDRTDIIHIQWTINGQSLTDEIKQMRGISVNTIYTNGGNSSLSIIGSEVNNGITIGCVVVTSGPPYVESKGALFTVTGIPPVMNLTINFTTNGVMMCTWSQPSCLPINYSYSISVNNVSMINTTSTVYSMSNISSCTDYTISILVTNTSSQNQSLPLIRTAKSGYYEKVDLQLRNNEQPSVIFCDTTHCIVITVSYKLSNGELLLDCDPTLSFLEVITPLSAEDTETTTERPISELLMNSYNSTTGLGTYTIGPYNDSFIANYSIQPQSNTGTISTIRISTFNVQQFSISNTSNGGIVMECGFAINSSADGCSVVFVNTQSHDQNETLFIPKGNNEDTAVKNIVSISPGEYSISVYDVIDGVTQTSTPAVTLYTSIDPTISGPLMSNEVLSLLPIITPVSELVSSGTVSLVSVIPSITLTTIPTQRTPTLHWLIVSAFAIVFVILLTTLILVAALILYYLCH